MAITASMVKELREKTGLGMMDCKKALSEADGDMALAIETLRKKGQATAEKRAGKAAKEGSVSAIIDGSTAILFELNCETDFVANSDDFTGFTAKLSETLKAAKPADLDAALATDMGGQPVSEVATELMGKIGEKVAFPNYVLEEAAAGEGVYSYVHSNGKVGAIVKLATDKASDDAIVALGKDIAMQVAAAAPLAIDKDGLDADLVAKEEEIFLEQLKNEGKPEEMAKKIIIGKMNKFFKQVTLVDQEFIKADKTSVAQHINAVAKEAGTTVSVLAMHRIELGASDTGTDED